MKKRIQVLPGCMALLLAAIGLGLLLEAEAVSAGVRKGLSVCGSVLIPSLFPFMVLAGFLTLTDYGRILSIPLRPLTTRLLKLPAELGAVVLLSMIGGYPVGAKMIASLLEQKRIDSETASRMLCFCVNAGPSFLVAAVGGGMFLDRRVGLVFFATQTFTTLLIGMLISLRIKKPPRIAEAPAPGAGAALVMAVQGATSAMFTMCAFAVLFSGLLSLLDSIGLFTWLAACLPLEEGIIRSALGGLLEVTTGCLAAAETGETAFALTSAILSFGGLSVLLQIMSCFGPRQVRFRPLVLARLAHAGISTAIAVPLLRYFYASGMAWAASRPPVVQADGRTTLISVCLLSMCSIFTLSIGPANTTRDC